MQKDDFGTMGRATIIACYWLFSMLTLALLLVDLVPFCHQEYPKVAFGLALYAPEAAAIILLAASGLFLTYLRILNIIFKNFSNMNEISSSILFAILLSIESAFLFSIGCF
jgi:hypothetical protein